MSSMEPEKACPGGAQLLGVPASPEDLVTFSCGRIKTVKVLDKSQRQSFELEGGDVIIVIVIKSGKALRAADGTLQGF